MAGGAGACGSGGVRAGVSCASKRPGRRTSRVAFVGEAPVEGDPLLSFPPYVHRAPRGNSITPARQRAFISALAATGIVTQAARSIGVSLEALYTLRRLEGAEGFALAWELAVERGLQRLEDCALERAIAGEERPVVRGGAVVATWRRHDTALLMFVLRQRLAAKWNGDRFMTRAEMADAKREIIATLRAEDDEPAVLASLNRKLDAFRARYEAERAQAAAGGDGAGGA